MKTSEILNRSADEILGRGWTQGGNEKNNGDPWGTQTEGAPVCLEGGLIAAMGIKVSEFGLPPDDFHTCPAYASVQQYLGFRENDLVFEWNDEEGRTVEEVIEVLRACALIESAKENSEVRELVSSE